MNTSALIDIEYLGDGVYAGHDGYHVVLWVESEGAFGPGAIAMEPGVLVRLDAYRKRVGEADGNG